MPFSLFFGDWGAQSSSLLRGQRPSASFRQYARFSPVVATLSFVRRCPELVEHDGGYLGDSLCLCVGFSKRADSCFTSGEGSVVDKGWLEAGAVKSSRLVVSPDVTALHMVEDPVQHIVNASPFDGTTPLSLIALFLFLFLFFFHLFLLPTLADAFNAGAGAVVVAAVVVAGAGAGAAGAGAATAPARLPLACWVLLLLLLLLAVTDAEGVFFSVFFFTPTSTRSSAGGKSVECKASTFLFRPMIKT